MWRLEQAFRYDNGKCGENANMPRQWPILLVAAIAVPLRAEDAPTPIGDAWHDPRNPIVKIFGGERLDLWSLKPVQRPAIPDSDTPALPIDRFVLQRLKPHGLSLSPEADARTLCRRLYFDLIGLPPS